MAIRKQLIKKNHVEAVYKIVNDLDASGTVTISLATDLKRDDETITTAKAAIRTMEWSVADATGAILIKRNGVVTQRLHSSTSIVQPFGADHDGDIYDLEITMTGGTLIIHVLKAGYIPTFQPEIHGGEV